MKILVTGHKGFIGNYVFNHLKTIGHQVSGIDFPDDIVNTFLNFDNYFGIHLRATDSPQGDFNFDQFFNLN